MLRWNGVAGIGNGEPGLPVRLFQRQGDMAALRAVFHGIVQQNGNQPPQPVSVPHHGNVRRDPLLQGLSRLKGHRLKGQHAVRGHIGEVQRLHGGRPDAIVRPGQGQHLLHQSAHLLRLGMDVAAPPGRLFRKTCPLQQLRVGEDHRQRRLQLVGGIRQKLPLLLPCLLHRPGDPAGCRCRNAQQHQHSSQCDQQVGTDQPPQHRLLHGHIHKGQFPVKAVVHGEVAEMVLVDRPLRRFLLQALAENVPQGIGILQIGIGTAGDIGGIPPDIHCEIRQQHPVPADLNGGVGHSAPAAVLPQDLIQHLAAEVLNILPDGVIGGAEHRREHQGHQPHAHRHEFPAQFPDHDKCLPLSKSLWKMLKKLWKSRIVRFPAPTGSPPCGWYGSLPSSGGSPAFSSKRKCRPPHCCPRHRIHTPTA